MPIYTPFNPQPMAQSNFIQFEYPIRFLLLLPCLLLFGTPPLPAYCLNASHLAEEVDTLPDGRYLWEMDSYEKALFYGDPMETETERQWRLREARQMGLDDLSLTASERLYLLGHKFSLALPSSRLMSGAAVADGLSRQGKHLIRLKDATPQLGEVLGFTIRESKIFLAGRAVSHGRFDFIISRNGQLSLGAGHHTLSGGAREVMAAGQLKLYNGQITRISNWSGHYQPTIEEAMLFPDLLRNLGLNISGAKLQLFNQEGQLIETIRLP